MFVPQKYVIRLARACFAVCLISVSYLALMPVEHLPTVSTWDKANHFVAFFVLTNLLYLCFAKHPLINVVVWLTAYGLLLELLQGLSNFRVFSYFDLLADVIGISAGLAIAIFSQRFVKQK